MADRSEIDQVRARVDLVSIVEQYVTLRRAGKTLRGLCPFHQEKTPSFHVNPELGLWKCYGQCSEGGDVFKFVQKIENLSFVEALERLALRAGVTLARDRAGKLGRGTGVPSEAGERDRLYAVNALALTYFREQLGHSRAAQDYLRERDLAHALQESFQVGFAPDVWEGLVSFLDRRGIAPADAEKAGLILKTDRGGYIDRLRGRLIFPIFDVQERPIAFGGRLIGEARPGQPKYWNSPETPVFSKSRTLYGLSHARKAIAARGRAVVVEGYTDVLAAHQAGFDNVVATLGTSLTEEHVQALARLAPTVLLAFDADGAGLKAAFRAAQIFEAHEVEVWVLDLPDGEDPDSLLRAGKRALFAQAMDEALPLVEYRLKRLLRKSPTESERDRVALFRKALPILALVPGAIEREPYIKMLTPYHPRFAEGAVYAEDQIRQDVIAYQQTGGAGSGAFQGAGSLGQNAGSPGRSAGHSAFGRLVSRPSMPPPGSATEQAERHLLRALVGADPALADCVRRGIRPEQFATPAGQALASRLYALETDGPAPDLGGLLASMEDSDLANALTGLLMEPDREPITMSLLEKEITHLRLRAKGRRLSALKARIDSGDAGADVLAQFVRLQGELRGSQALAGHSTTE